MKFQTFLNEAKLNDNFKDVDDVLGMLNTVENALSSPNMIKFLKNADKETGNTGLKMLREAINAIKDVGNYVETLYKIEDAGTDLFA